MTRLRVLNSLPKQYQADFFEYIRAWCGDYMEAASYCDWRVDCELEAEELFSEVIAKLLGVSGTGIGSKHGPGVNGDEEDPAIPDNGEPEKQLVWLLLQAGGSLGLKHRHEDIRRRRHGGKWTGDGYRQGQLETEHIEGLSVDPDDPHHNDDARKAWRGLLRMAVSEFKPGDDVLFLLDLMAHDPEVQAAFGTEWPVSRIVSALNLKHSMSPWNDDRVENAKKRLKNWIVRLKRTRGLDANDLMDLFARRGCEEE